MSKYVKKAAGDLEKYSRKKLKRYLHNIKVPHELVDEIIAAAEAKMADQVSTREITELVTERLNQLENSDVYCARYNLKGAVRKMGPAGHVFEKYIARLFEADGFEVTVGEQVQGECVEHELDVIARKPGELEVIEAKFHNQEGIRSDIQVALYVYARFQDVVSKFDLPNGGPVAWIATNTKLTSTAYSFAKCRGMHLLSIELPRDGSITDRVVEQGLFPISSLDVLEPYLDELFRAEFIMLSDVLNLDSKTSQKLGIPTEIVNVAQTKATSILAVTNGRNGASQ